MKPIIISIVNALSLLLSTLAAAQPGSLDVTFGIGGIVTTMVGSGNDAGNSAVIQSDGKIIVAGYSRTTFAIARYNTNGILDNTFGLGGIVTTTIGTGNAVVNSIALQSDGKIVVGGFCGIYPNFDFAIVRYHANGALDNSFDTDGRVTTSIGSTEDRVWSIAIQSDGKILCAGNTFNGTNSDFALVRYHIDGSLDNTFDNDGITTLAVGPANDIIRSIEIQGDGKIVVAGFSYQAGSTDYEFVIGRYNSNGSLDHTFGNDGLITTDIVNGNDYGESVQLQSDGKIVVGGYNFNGFLCLVRYNSNGTLDHTFGINGKVNTAFGCAFQNVYSMALQSDGKIVIGGYSNMRGNNSDFALARFESNGMLDNTFGTGGVIVTPIGNGDDICTSIVIQPDEKIVLTGMSYNGTNFDFVLARYNNSFSTGLNSNTVKPPEIKIYPLPSHGNFNIESCRDGQLELQIINLFGEIILQQQFSIDCSIALQGKGIYFIRIYDGKINTTKRIIIE